MAPPASPIPNPHPVVLIPSCFPSTQRGSRCPYPAPFHPGDTRDDGGLPEGSRMDESSLRPPGSGKIWECSQFRHPPLQSPKSSPAWELSQPKAKFPGKTGVHGSATAPEEQEELLDPAEPCRKIQLKSGKICPFLAGFAPLPHPGS